MPATPLDQLRLRRDDERPARRRRALWWAVVALAALALAYGFLRDRPIAVRVQIIPAVSAEGQPAAVLNASGYVVARREATVSAKMTGKVVEVTVEEGMEVTAGQVLARLDASNVEVSLQLAEAQVAAASSNTAETQAQLEEAEKEFRRFTALARDGIASAADLDQAAARRDALTARLERQRQDTEVARRQVAVLRQQLDDTVIRAPFDGVAVSKDAQPGEMISPVSAGGGFTRTGISTIVDMTSLEIEVDVNESYINRIHSSQPVEARLDAYPDWTIPCSVIAIVPTADRQKATVRVRVGFDRLDARLLPEMGVKVAFLARPGETETAPGFILPEPAVHRRNGEACVAVVEAGRIAQRPVTVDPAEDGQVRILSGLRPGDRVVVEPPRLLANGTRVKESSP